MYKHVQGAFELPTRQDKIGELSAGLQHEYGIGQEQSNGTDIASVVFELPLMAMSEGC
jgi:hypothetical protein